MTNVLPDRASVRQPGDKVRLTAAAVGGVLAGASRAFLDWLLELLSTSH